MNGLVQEYQRWKENVSCPVLKKELDSIKNNTEEIRERFFRGLEFGTGGMRGIIGAGPNRINIYTIRKTTQGLANYLKSKASPEENRVVIAYDSRHKSREFALEAASVLAYNRIKTYVFDKITPTPLLSYAVRELQATAGIVITASHNPKEYNGYKVYNNLGGQITDELADIIIAEIEKIDDLFAIKVVSEEKAVKDGLLLWLYDEIVNRYLHETGKLVLNKELLQQTAGELKVVYSPLHGTGLVPLVRLFERSGFSNLHVVQQQAIADPNFSTVVCPNPEDEAACKLAIQNAEEVEADLIMLTDPDADRIGMVVKNDAGSYELLSGNQTGALLIDYILKSRHEKGTIPPNGVIVKTIVTSNMGAQIAARYGVKCIEVLTGFKYIAEKIAEFEISRQYAFLFGYEESYGYLIGTHARDKDAIQAALLLAEMTLYHKKNGITVYRRLNELFENFGYYMEDLLNIQLNGLEGQQKISGIMEALRLNPPGFLKSYGLSIIKDYLYNRQLNLDSKETSRLELPSSNVIYYVLRNDCWCCIRPSGTEPKLKIYLGVKDLSPQDAQAKIKKLRNSFLKYCEPYLQ